MGSHLLKKIDTKYEHYLRDESRLVGKAETISFPESHDEIVEVIKYCYTNNIRVTVQGARTGLAAGSVPMEGHIMNLMKMDKILAIRSDRNGAFYLKAQPGLILSKLRELIKTKRLDCTGFDESSLEAYKQFIESEEMFFSPDPTETSATLGGMVACNASGARSYLYGSIRNHITGLKVVLSDGESLSLRRGENFAKGRELRVLTDSGGEILLDLPKYNMPRTKNASGYFIEDNMDAIDLFIGSDGTLGVISEIEIKLLKLPNVIWGAMCLLQKAETVDRFVDFLRAECEHVSSIEYFDSNSLEILRMQKIKNTAFKRLPDVEKDINAAIYIEIHADTEVIALDTLRKVASELEVIGEDSSNSWVARNQFDKDKLYFFRHAVPESVNMLIDQKRIDYPNITKLGTDMSVPDEYLSEIMNTYNSMLKERNLKSATWGHIGNNHLHVNILPENEEEYIRGKELYVEWASIVTQMGGAVSAEHGVGKLKSGMLTIMYGDKYISEMRKLKAQLDPIEILGIGSMFSVEEGDVK